MSICGVNPDDGFELALWQVVFRGYWGYHIASLIVGVGLLQALTVAICQESRRRDFVIGIRSRSGEQAVLL
ncbi:MAG: hypothetical protein J07HQX50_01385 [Haloquadratum sp. J07HQX50]|nr:MAG: hypothetical protein J07HQX50_01385 [Haloquadratum sp. J07HQX50]